MCVCVCVCGCVCVRVCSLVHDHVIAHALFPPCSPLLAVAFLSFFFFFFSFCFWFWFLCLASSLTTTASPLLSRASCQELCKDRLRTADAERNDFSLPKAVRTKATAAHARWTKRLAEWRSAFRAAEARSRGDVDACKQLVEAYKRHTAAAVRTAPLHTRLCVYVCVFSFCFEPAVMLQCHQA